MKFFIIFFLAYNFIISQTTPQIKPQSDSSKARELLREATVKSTQKELNITIRNVDITAFPIVKIIVEAYNIFGEPLDTLYADKLFVLENNVPKKVISIEKISIRERIPVDFVFVIDKTGSMQNYIDDVKRNITKFTTSIVQRGIDYRLGLVLFSDWIEKVYEPQQDVYTFLEWLSPVKAAGGGDAKENALEALDRAASMSFRPSANKVIVLITDAPYHQKGENGEGTTNYTTNTIIDYLVAKEARVFCIVAPQLKNYEIIARQTRGNFFDIGYPFATILDNFSTQLTNLFALKYRTNEPAIPDSINIALLNQQKQELVRKTIPIVELGRKLIIENLLYETNSSELSASVPELEILNEFMKNKTNVTILVEGHTDNIGADKTNNALSLLRAESVKKYLVKKGIPEKRIKTKGYGKRHPIADNTTEFGRKLNRRTEIVITGK